MAHRNETDNVKVQDGGAERRKCCSWRPVEQLESADIDHALKNLIYDGVCSQIMVTLTSGVFLVAYALAMGAGNVTIGILAAIGPFAQIAQLPMVSLVTRFRRRKALVLMAGYVGRLMFPLLAVLPLWLGRSGDVRPLIGLLLAYSLMNSLVGCSWNSWVRDVVPEKTMGDYFSRRLRIATLVGAVLSLVAGLVLDYGSRYMDELNIYSLFFMFAGMVGLFGLLFLERTPEPRMAPAASGNVFRQLAEPFCDARFRKVLLFSGFWSAAVNMAAPFFTVYILKRLELSMGWVMGLAVTSQLMNVACLRMWGRLADRFSNKSVLSVAGFFFIVTLLIWPFTTLPGRYVLSIPLLIAIHVFAGLSMAGVTLCTGNLALRAAPKGNATAFLAANALVTGCCASLAPIAAGTVADLLAGYQLKLTFEWLSPQNVFKMPALNLQGLDFIFIIAFFFGLYALHRLLAVREEGEAGDAAVKAAFVGEMRRMVRPVYPVAGVRYLVQVPLLIQDKVADALQYMNNKQKPGSKPSNQEDEEHI